MQGRSKVPALLRRARPFLGAGATSQAAEGLALGSVPVLAASLHTGLPGLATLRPGYTPNYINPGFAGQFSRAISVDALQPSDSFERRHNSTTVGTEAAEMLETIGWPSVDALIDATVPDNIRRTDNMDMGQYTEARGESAHLAYITAMGNKNKVFKSYIGQGYYNTHVPPVILRNVLENPGWYTQYTPYQAEIAQGRLESLLNYQTLITDLTAMPMANASLLDEGTAAAEAMTMCSAIARGKKPKFLVSDLCHPQTIAVCKTRAEGLGLELVVGDIEKMDMAKDVCGMLLQYPATDGTVTDMTALVNKAHAAGVKVCCAADLLALTLLKPPGEMGVDICIGTAQRFGVPMGYGGPHAAYLATSDEYKRLMPGRIIGVSIDSEGNPALRMAMQTREQHIRRDKATSNICTAQALLANMAAMYAVYHGPEGLKTIATRVHGLVGVLATGAEKLGYTVRSKDFFDTITISKGPGSAAGIVAAAAAKGCNVRALDADNVSIAFDETTLIADVDEMLEILGGGKAGFTAESLAASAPPINAGLSRTSSYLTAPVFHAYHTEHEMLRYLKRLENKDLSLCHSMIALGSCTMKLNATAEMIPITQPGFANMHPFAPEDQVQGYKEMFEDLSQQLVSITGFDGISLQPNSGASGEYAGLMAIRAYHQSRGDHNRNVCIIPVSAHGTNPASAAMAGMKVVVTGTDKDGNVDMEDMRKAVEKHSANLAALMVTYPSTHGVYEDGIRDMCQMIHDHGGQVYMDGANMNAQVGLTSPGHIGADVCHLNLHKTFCIPHGGGGPGMGPICVREQLVPFMPNGTAGLKAGGETPFGAVASAPYGSAAILPISYSYIALMGSEGLTNASKYAILNANYMAKRLEDSYPILFRGKNGTCAHEFILDLRPLKASSGVECEDVAKRLMDYGYHAPTMSWPVSGTLMVEPTESESKAELDRFCDAMIAIRAEIAAIETGAASPTDNVLKNAPHTADMIMSSNWSKPYSREEAAYPASWVAEGKFWPTTARIDNVYGDRNLVTTLTEKETEAEAA